MITVSIVPNKLYRGWRDANGVAHVTVNREPLRHVAFHSSEGFDWGSTGVQAADLALSILADYFSEHWVTGKVLRELRPEGKMPNCWMYHQAFKQDVVARLIRETGATWKITSFMIMIFLDLEDAGEFQSSE